MEVENNLAYCDTATITAIKSFIVQAHASGDILNLLPLAEVATSYTLCDEKKSWKFFSSRPVYEQIKVVGTFAVT